MLPSWCARGWSGENGDVQANTSPIPAARPSEGPGEPDLARYESLHERARQAVAASRAARDRSTAATRVRALVGELEQALHELDGLRTAMQTRGVIEQAKGIVMLAYRCSADDAFAELVRLSQSLQLKLHEVATRLVSEVASGSPGAISASFLRGGSPRPRATNR